MIIFLIGFMGCGKTTVGRRVARRVGYGFADMDKMIEVQAGKSVSDIFTQEGESVFRSMETALLESFDAADDLIVATGGGAPCSEGNLDIMKAKGRVVYFKMSPERIFPRLEKGRWRRPKIAGMNDVALMDYITRTLAEREKYYSQASMTIDCDGVSDEYIATHISYYIESCRNQS